VDISAPFDEQEVVGLPLAETVTMSRHIRTAEIRVLMNLAPLADLRDPKAPHRRPRTRAAARRKFF
jgi:hypothetical protein